MHYILIKRIILNVYTTTTFKILKTHKLLQPIKSKYSIIKSNYILLNVYTTTFKYM